MSSWSLLISETGLQTKLFFRSTVAAFFTLVLPLMFLIMINFFVPGSTDDPGEASQYITAAIAVFGLVTATFTNLAINTSMARDSGILKRVAGTPLSMSIHLGGRVMSAVLVGILSVSLMLLMATMLFDVSIPWGRMPWFVAMLMLGAAAWSALGLAVAAMTPSARAAPAVANFVILPLAFISGIFFPLDQSPEWMQTVASVLPLEPLVTSAVDIFIPSIPLEAPWAAILKLALWGAIGMLAANRFFSYEPSTHAAGGAVSRHQSPTEIETNPHSSQT